MPVKQRSRAFGACAAVIAIVALGPSVSCSSSGPPPVAADSVNFLVLQLMQCDDCRDNLPERVVALNALAVPLLRHYLLNGPPPEYVVAMRATLETPDTSGHQLAPRIIALQLANYDAMYRVRAARTLRAIGGPDARVALCAGAGLGTLRPNVRSVVVTAATAAGPCP